MYEIFQRLLDEKGITPYRVSKETGIASSTLTDWKLGRSTPKADKIQTIANYFGVDVSLFYGDSVPSEQKEMDIPEIHVINRAAKKMDQAKRDRMMTILRASFMEEFDED